MTAIAATQTVQILNNHELVPTPGRIIAPGLAITPSVIHSSRYVITHLPSGHALIYSRCAEHIQAAADMLTSRPFDWTLTVEQVTADQECMRHLRAVCDRFPWQFGTTAVLCNACDGPIGGTR